MEFVFNEHEIVALPAPLAAIIPRKDLYLAEVAATSQDRTIVTTDRELKNRLHEQGGFRVILLDEFLESYLD